MKTPEFVSNTLAAIFGFFEKLKQKRAEAKREQETYKDRQKYSFFKIQYDPKYNGTYMLFGYFRPQNQMLLLNETINPMEAQRWCADYGCGMPEIPVE